MKNLEELYRQAVEETKSGNLSDVCKRYAELSGAKIVSEYSDEIARILKEHYFFKLYHGCLCIEKSPKQKILPIFSKEDIHVFSKAGIIIDNKDDFWREFIFRNFDNEDELFEIKKAFKEADKRIAEKQQLFDMFGVIEYKTDSDNGVSDLIKSIPNLKSGIGSVQYKDKYIALNYANSDNDGTLNVFITKEPLSKDQVAVLNDFYYDYPRLQLNNNDFIGYEDDKFSASIEHCTIETKHSNFTSTFDVSAQTIDTLMPMVQNGSGSLEFIHPDLKGWSVDIRPLTKFLPHTFVFDVRKDKAKKITCVLNLYDYEKYSIYIKENIQNLMLDGWLAQTDVENFSEIKNKLLERNTLFVSVKNLGFEAMQAAGWLGDFERCLALTIIKNEYDKVKDSL